MAYRVLPEYLDKWYGGAPTKEYGDITMKEIIRLAREWQVPVKELLKQVEEV